MNDIIGIDSSSFYSTVREQAIPYFQVYLIHVYVASGINGWKKN